MILSLSSVCLILAFVMFCLGGLNVPRYGWQSFGFAFCVLSILLK